MPSSSWILRTAYPTSRQWWLWRIGLVVVALVYLIQLGGLGTYPAFGPDRSVYMVTAKSLAEGQGYRQLNFPDAPPAIHYPIGYPWILSCVMRVMPFGPAQVLVIRAMSALTMIGATVLWRRLMAEFLHPLLAILTTLLLAMSSLSLSLAGLIMSDPLFTLLLAATVLAARRTTARTDASVKFAVMTGVLAAMAMLVRSAGIAVVGGVFLAMCFQRRWKAAGAFLITAGVLLSPWLLWTMHHAGGTYSAYVRDAHQWKGLNPPATLWFIISNMPAPILFPPFQSAVAARFHLTAAMPAVGLMIAAITLIGGAWLIRRHVAEAWVAVSYMGMLLAYFAMERFLVPVYPLLAICFWIGIAMLIRNERWQRIASAAVLCVMISGVTALVIARSRIEFQYRAGSSIEAKGDQQMLAALDWIRTNTPPDALVIATYPEGVYLFTDRHTLLLEEDPNQLKQLIQNTHGHSVYVLVDDRPTSAQMKNRATLSDFERENPGFFVERWRDKNNWIQVLQVSPK